MTISTTDNRVSFAGNGSTTAFATGFKFYTQTDLVVVLVTDSTGAEAVQTITTNYTVTGTGSDSGGTVTMVTAPASGETLVIYRDQPYTQGLDLVENDPFPSNSVEEQLDKNVVMTQQNADNNNRTLRQPEGDTADIDFLPAKVLRATKVLAFDADGDPVVSTETLSEIEGAATSATAAAASAAAAAASETNAATSETNAANSAASAAASAQGFAAVTLLTAASNDIETTDARTYYQVDASSNTVAINLPAIGTGNDGLSYTVEVLDVSNAITIVRDGSDTINGVAGDYTGLVEVGQVIQIIADDGTPDNWIVVQSSALKVDDTTVELSGRTIQVKDDGITPDKAEPALNEETGTAYTLALTDNLLTVFMTNASANTVTIPTNASAAFGVDVTRVDIVQQGAGVTTITGDTGVTLNGVSAGSADISAQYGAVSLWKRGTDTWVMAGAHGAVA